MVACRFSLPNIAVFDIAWITTAVRALYTTLPHLAQHKRWSCTHSGGQKFHQWTFWQDTAVNWKDLWLTTSWSWWRQCRECRQGKQWLLWWIWNKSHFVYCVTPCVSLATTRYRFAHMVVAVRIREKTHNRTDFRRSLTHATLRDLTRIIQNRSIAV